jgi:hypothetical protein
MERLNTIYKFMWNFRIIKKDDAYGLYEVFYNDDGKIFAHDENPTIIGESVDDLKKYLKMMSSDVDKCKNAVLEYDDIDFAPMMDDEEDDDLSGSLEDFMDNFPKE